MKKGSLAFLAILFIVSIVSAYDLAYPFAGTYDWECPANNTSMFVNMAGAGGSGASSGTISGYSTWGYGGSAGEYGNITMVTVVPGTHYPIIVGAKGGQANTSIYGPGSPAITHAGTDTTAFGYTKHGGAGGIMGGYWESNGLPGVSTNFLTLTRASMGGNTTTTTGGLGGIGYGAGGGGASSNASTGDYGYRGATHGGAGMDGYVGLWDMNGSGANVPYYTATPTSTGYGGLITFTDESLLNDAANLTYLWDFGDTTTSSVIGTTTHVYSTYGTFTTNLTITSDLGTVFLRKADYITITNVPITAWYSQKLVRLKIVDAFGNDLDGANISISYISNTLPSKDAAYLTSAFGIPQAVATQMVAGGLAMQGWSDSDGSAVFTMFPAIQYGITITNETAGLSKYVTIYPQDAEYIIYCPLTSQVEPTSRTTSLYNASLYVTEPNASWITWNLIYNDTSGYTTALTWNVTNWNNMSVMYTKTWGAIPAGSIVADNYTFPSVPAGEEYRAVYRATRVIP